MFHLELPEKYRRYVPLAAWVVVFLVFLAIPLKIIGYGFLPIDDALRHSAKAIANRPWTDILVVGDNFKIDHNLGWHGLLHHLSVWFNWDAENLVIFSVVALFFIVNAAALPWLKRPEAWLIAFLWAVMTTDLAGRMTLGRPFMLTLAVLVVILLSTHQSAPSFKKCLLFTALITACTFVHGVWYMWVLPIAAFIFAGQYLWAAYITLAWVVGVSTAALLTGHPVDYLSQAFNMATGATSVHATSRTMVTEFQPGNGNIFALCFLGGAMLLRLILKPNLPSLTRSPVFWLMTGCWLLSFRVGRFWEDWGGPALVVLIALEMEWFLLARMAADSLQRLFLVLILGAAAFLSASSDLDNRWSQSLNWTYLTPQSVDKPEWLPGKKGIIYSIDMTIFYQTFFKNPHADWRYVLGYEPWLMPKDDFETYHKILWNYGDAQGYAPWVKKMKPEDRLVMRGTKGGQPNISGLEWNYAVSGIWIGRLPQTNSLPVKDASH